MLTGPKWAGGSTGQAESVLTENERNVLGTRRGWARGGRTSSGAGALTVLKAAHQAKRAVCGTRHSGKKKTNEFGFS